MMELRNIVGTRRYDVRGKYSGHERYYVGGIECTRVEENQRYRGGRGDKDGYGGRDRIGVIEKVWLNGEDMIE